MPRFDVDGYLEEIDRCRAAFPQLRIGTGLEFGQPGLRTEAARATLDLDAFDRVIGSLHTVSCGDRRAEPNTLFRRLPADEVLRAYLAEVPAVVAADGPHEIVTHIDYAVRYWPEAAAGAFDPADFEEEFRAAMRAIADSGRALEINTRRLRPWIPQWWAEEGGCAVSFGSDAHVPSALAANFTEATALAAAHGFRPGKDPRDLWRR